MARNSVRDRRICYDAHKYVGADGRPKMKCWCCKVEFDVATSRWEAHHNVLHTNGGESTGENLLPMLYKCHRKQTAEVDIPAAAKTKRIAKKHLGLKRSSRPMPGSRDSAWKRKMDGTIVKRR